MSKSLKQLIIENLSKGKSVVERLDAKEKMIEVVNKIRSGSYSQKFNLSPSTPRSSWTTDFAIERIALVLELGKVSSNDMKPGSSLKAKTFQPTLDRMIQNEIVAQSKEGSRVFYVPGKTLIAAAKEVGLNLGGGVDTNNTAAQSDFDAAIKAIKGKYKLSKDHPLDDTFSDEDGVRIYRGNFETGLPFTSSSTYKSLKGKLEQEARDVLKAYSATLSIDVNVVNVLSAKLTGPGAKADSVLSVTIKEK